MGIIAVAPLSVVLKLPEQGKISVTAITFWRILRQQIEGRLRQASREQTGYEGATKSSYLPDGEAGSRGSAGTYLGLWVPGVVVTPSGALSSPASMAARMRAQNASSMRFARD